MKNFSRFFVNLIILPLILWLPLKGITGIFAQASPPASVKIISVSKSGDTQLAKDLPGARLSLAGRQSIANPQAAPHVIAEYKGDTTIEVHGILGGSNELLYSLTGKADLQLIDDGTFKLITSGYPKCTTENTYFAECDPNTLIPASIYGTYTNNPNKLNIDVMHDNTNSNVGDVFKVLGNVADNANVIGSFTDTTAEGSLVFMQRAGGEYDIHIDFKLNIVSGSATQEASPTPGMGCAPTVGNISGLKPGDILSPSVEFSNPDGKPVAPLSMVWYINGQQTSSINWDGNEANIELQYTCPDNSAHTQNYTVAAYNSQQPPSAPQAPAAAPPVNQPPLENFSVTLDPSNVALVGGVGALVTGGVLAGVLLAGPKPPVFPLPDLPSQPPVPQPPIQSVLPAQPPATTQPGENFKPIKNKLTPKEKTDLINRRDEMQAEVDHLVDQWKQSRNDADKLTTLNKKNMLKFIFKKGLDTKDWVTTNPVELIKKVTVDPIMDKIFSKHETAGDGKITVDIHNKIGKDNAKMHDIADQVKYLRNEIAQTNQTLAEGGE